MLYFWCEKLCPLGRTFFCIFGAKNYEGKRLLPLRQWGGVSLFAYSPYIKPAFIRPCFRSPPSLHQVKRASNQVKIGQKQTFICLILSNLGIFGDRKGRNTNIFLKYGAGVGCRVLLWWWCPLVAYVPDSGPAGPAIGWLWSSGGALPAFCPLVCFVLVVSLANMALFRVLRGF